MHEAHEEDRCRCRSGVSPRSIDKKPLRATHLQRLQELTLLFAAFAFTGPDKRICKEDKQPESTILSA